jgi:hypothetical protein
VSVQYIQPAQARRSSLLSPNESYFARSERRNLFETLVLLGLWGYNRPIRCSRLASSSSAEAEAEAGPGTADRS